MSDKIKIISTGSYLPKRVLTNGELSQTLGVEPDWITQRTGVESRHVAAESEATSEMATEAARLALQNAGLKISDIDMILVSTSISDTTLPPTACRVHKNLNAPNIPAFDVAASCSGFIYGIATASAYIKAGMAKRILFCCSELRSKFIDYTDTNTASVYGDGAGAVILEPSYSHIGFGDISLGADGKGCETITIPAGGTRLPATEETLKNGLHYIRFHDKTIIKSAVRGLKTHIDAKLKELGIDKSEIDIIVPHQMNLRMIESLSKRLHIPYEKFIVNIQRTGNTSSASIPIAIDEALKAGTITKGQLCMMLSYGAGFTWGTAFYQF